MNEGAFEAKLQSPAGAKSKQTASLPAKIGEAVARALSDAEAQRLVERIWQKDATLWKTDEAQTTIINNSLGWLTVARSMLPAAEELTQFADAIRTSGQFNHVMVCGMGGSSLCPEVLRQTFGRQPGFPELLVLDSTDPDTIHRFVRQIDVRKCLFIIASKSGTTTEPTVFHKFWYDTLAKTGATAGESFIAITDPGTKMVKTAEADHFRKIFINQPDIGGRYSALSYFGMTPAALMGLKVSQLLHHAVTAADACAASVPLEQNAAALLGLIMGECARAGRDKLTILTDENISALGLWIEQLIAESTGKEGKGIVPIVGEALGNAADYGDDRLFVFIGAGDDLRLKSLEAAGHPVIRRPLTDLYELGAEFFVWEFATAVAGWRIGINPFDQPNVQESKDKTKALLEQFTKDGKLPEQKQIASNNGLTIYGDESAASLEEAIRAHIKNVKTRDYVAMLAYLEETTEIDAALNALRGTIEKVTHAATTVGYGPRFLHSTGQLHKGGPDTGVFIQLTASDHQDFPIPGEAYTFSTLKDAQALGDFQSLVAHGRRAIRVDLGADEVAGLKYLQEIISRE